MEPWEDELLWDDDFSDEEEGTEEQIEEADLEMDEDGFAAVSYTHLARIKRARKTAASDLIFCINNAPFYLIFV